MAQKIIYYISQGSWAMPVWTLDNKEIHAMETITIKKDTIVTLVSNLENVAIKIPSAEASDLRSIASILNSYMETSNES